MVSALGLGMCPVDFNNEEYVVLSLEYCTLNALMLTSLCCDMLRPWIDMVYYRGRYILS